MASNGKAVELQKAVDDTKMNKDVHAAEEKDSHELEEEERKKNFVPSQGLTSAEGEALLKEWGRNELEEKSTPKWLIFLKMLWGPMPIMIWIAVIVELGIQNWLDAGILLGIQFANATIGWYETTKAGDAVAALKASLKPEATVKRDGKWQKVDAGILVPGDLVLLASGSAVPADCRVNHGQIQVDQSALTGESLPVTMYPGDSCKMGSTVTRGEVEGTVEFTGKHTFFGKTATMLQQGDSLGNLQKILIRIMIVLVVLSLTLCAITLGYLLGKGVHFKEALSFTVVLLIASIPIAIEIVCTATLALGSRQLSSHGAIVTRLTSIEEMAGMNMLCSDKTGTLTLNKMVIQDDCPIFSDGHTLETVLQHAAMAAKWREPPRDALDTMVLGAAKLDELEHHEQTDFLPFDPTIKRTEGTIKDPSGKVFKVTKGAPNILLELVSVNKATVSKAVDWKVQELAVRGIRSLAVAKTNDNGEWEMLGLLTFLDPPRPDTKRTIERAIEYGVDVKMITGDHTVIAKEMARTLGMGDNIKNAKGLPTMAADGTIPKDLGEKYGQMILEADGFAQVYPEHKFLIVEALRQAGFACGMTGDGVNDAPALKKADVGIAVQGSTDAARAAADIVLTQPGLSVVVEAIVIARMIFQRIKNFINYRIAATLQLLVFFFIAVLALDPKHYYKQLPKAEQEKQGEWPEFFSLPVLMLMLITLLNDGTLISIGYDYVNPSPRPEKWNLKALFVISSVLGAIACVSSLLLLWGALDSHNPDGMFAAFNLPSLPYGKVTTLIYLKVSLSDFLTLFSARTHSEFFWGRKPSPILLGAAGCALTLSTILACVWPEGKTDKIHTMGLARGGETKDKLWPLWVWLYCIFWWFVQDAAKVATYWLMTKYDIFQIRTAGLINLREAQRADDSAHPLARQSVGVTEQKNLEIKVDQVLKRVEDLARQSGGTPNLARVSQKLALARKSGGLSRMSVGGAAASRADMEAGVAEAEQVISEIQEAAEGADPKDKAELQASLAKLQQATTRLAETKDAAK